MLIVRYRLYNWIFFLLIMMGGNIVTSQDFSEQKNDLTYWLWYSYQESETLFNSLTIDTESNVTAQIQYTEMDYPLRALGFFFFKPGLDDSDIRQIGRLIREKGLLSDNVYTQPPSFGIQSVYFNIKADGQDVMHDLNPMEPMPESFHEVELLIERLFKRAEVGPLRTLSMSIIFEPPNVKPDDDLRIIINIRNSGKFPTEFRNPANFTNSALNSFRLNFWSKGGDKSSKVFDEFEWTLDLTSREFLVSEYKTIPSQEPYLNIPPSETLRFWTIVRFPKMELGEYMTELIYYAMPGGKEEENRSDLILGEYHSDLKKLIVLKR